MPNRVNDDDEGHDDKPTSYALGRISGQLRELIHTMKSVQQGQVALEIRLAKLEEAESQRRGAANLLALILKSPFVGWLAALAAAFWAILTGRIHT